MNQRKVATQKELTANNPQQMLFAEELATTTPLYPSNSTHQALEHKFKNLIHEELKLGSLVSYVRTKMTERKYKGDTFHNQWQSFRIKKNQKVDYEATHKYE